MNYRHKLLRQILQQQEAKWNTERTNLQGDILNLQNSTDIKLLEEAQQKNKELRELLNNTINLLGEEDIKTTTDLSNLLRGQTLKELVQEKELLTQKVKDQDTALIQLAKQKIKGKKEAEYLMNTLETDFSKKQIEWETERGNINKEREKEREQWERELAQSREIITNLEKDKGEQQKQLKTLLENNDKLSKEKDKLILDKNTLTNDKKLLAETIRKEAEEKEAIKKELEECKRERERESKKVIIEEPSPQPSPKKAGSSKKKKKK